MEGSKERSHLIMFTGTECTHCHAMDPLVDQLEKDVGVKVDRLEVWHNAENARMLEKYDQGYCGGIPFFYNTKSQKWICGESDYDGLKAWALS